MKTAKQVAKEIILAYMPKTALSYAEKVSIMYDIAHDDNKVLLDHIDVIISIMKEAKKQIKEEKKNGPRNSDKGV